MARKRSYQVKEVATIAGVSVRTLHHYDEIGLLVPQGRTDAGYRLYDDDDLLRLQQIIIGRELGLALEEIRRSLDDPEFDRKGALLGQREQLAQRARQTDAMLRAVEAALAMLDTRAADKEGDTMDMKEIFYGFDPKQYETETEQRWGNSDAYKESMTRSRRYGKQDWLRCAAEQSAVYADAFRLMEAGRAPEATEATDVAERHRLAIDRWFYPCSYAMHSGLADMYEQDSRFAENIDKHGAGLTPFLSAAIRANAKRQGH